MNEETDWPIIEGGLRRCELCGRHQPEHAFSCPRYAGNPPKSFASGVIEAVRDHWFTQGGEARFGPLPECHNADELVSAILAAVETKYCHVCHHAHAKGEPHSFGTWPREDLRRAFVEGAKWWEYHSTDFTMWPSDQDKAADEADRRYPEGQPK